MRFLTSLFDPNKDGPLGPSRRELATLALYVACAGLYLVIGLYTTDFLLSFWVACLYLLATAWLVPTAVRRVL